MTSDAQQTRRPGLATGLPTAPARRALIEYARRRRLRLDELADVLHLDDLDVPGVVQGRRLPWPLADRIAVALGHHPYELWPEWFDDIDDADAQPAEQGAPG